MIQSLGNGRCEFLNVVLGGRATNGENKNKRRQHPKNTTQQRELGLPRARLRHKHTFKRGLLITPLGREPSVQALLTYIPVAGPVSLDTGPYLIHRHAYNFSKTEKKKIAFNYYL